MNYQCTSCGKKTAKWAGKCPNCQTFGVMEEISGTGKNGSPVAGVKSKTSMKSSVVPARRISEIDTGGSTPRSPTHIGELDRVLGGGLVAGQVVLIAGEPGVGKALALDTPILTSQGWTSMGEVKVGDEVLSLQGSFTSVIQTSEVYHDRECYRIGISNGDILVADANHLWSVQKKTDGGDFSDTEIVDTKTIYMEYRDVVGVPQMFLPKVPFHLYGTNTNGAESVRGMVETCFSDSLSAHDCDYLEKEILNSIVEERVLFINELCKKHFHMEPDLFTHNTDGSVNCSLEKPLKFKVKNENLAQLIASVVSSIGGGSSYEKGNGSWWVKLENFGMQNHHFSFVEKISNAPVKCIQVSSPDGMFLVGKKYTPTHNSTLLLEAANSYSSHGEGRVVLYVSGEESVEQISIRGKRIGANSSHIFLADETDVEGILTHVHELSPELVIVDSVQTIASPHIDGRAGGMAQVQEVSTILTRLAKSEKIPTILVGQINKSNDLAGPKTLEHLVDTVLMFEGDSNSGLRILRSVKNRFGPADEMACFEQTETGVIEVPDPSGLFLTERENAAVGVASTITMEGRRALAVEVQSLATFTSAPNPRRGVSGLDFNRTAMLIAVTEKHGKVRFYDKDTFVATVGGVKISEPAIDLAICASLLSSEKNVPFPADAVAIGEVTLSGDVRKVRNMRQRVAEAKRLGYSKVFLPHGEKVEGIIGIKISHISELRELFTK